MQDIRERTFGFAVEITKIYRELRSTESGRILGRQLLRSGTSIGANVVEADAGATRREFAYRMSVALGEARETQYWLRLLEATGHASGSRLDALISETEEPRKTLATIIRNTKRSGL